MANTNAPFGFRQYAGNGSAPTYEQIEVQIAYNASNIFFGDPVEPSGDGTVVRGDGTTGAAGIAGIFVGCQYLSVSQKRTVWSNYWPGTDVAATQVVEGYIVNDPNARFVAQVGGSTTTGLTAAAVNANVQFSYGTGNTAIGISGAFIAVDSPAVTATLPFRVVGLVEDPPGSPGTEAGAYNWAVVAFNNINTRTTTGV
jgi:hypothetical protein